MVSYRGAQWSSLLMYWTFAREVAVTTGAELAVADELKSRVTVLFVICVDIKALVNNDETVVARRIVETLDKHWDYGEILDVSEGWGSTDVTLVEADVLSSGVGIQW